MADRYYIQPEGFAAHVRPAKPVDMVFADEHDAEIAAIKAENERLHMEEEETFSRLQSRIIELERALAERAGGVNVMAHDILDSIKALDDAGFGDGPFVFDSRQELKEFIFALTTEPAAPEGRQEARSGDAQDIANRLRSFFSEPGDARRLALDAAMMIEYLNKPALRPSEQVVTEAMVDAVVKAIRPYTRDTLFLDEHQILVRAALKAAMEDVT